MVRPEDIILEKLSDLEHDQWAHWTRYMLDTIAKELGVSIEDLECVKRWRRQISTPYEELSEKEKESDRNWARKVLAVLDS